MGSPDDDRKTGLGNDPRVQKDTEIPFMYCPELLHVQAGSQKESFAPIQRQFSGNTLLEYGHFQSSPAGWKRALMHVERDMCKPSLMIDVDTLSLSLSLSLFLCAACPIIDRHVKGLYPRRMPGRNATPQTRALS